MSSICKHGRYVGDDEACGICFKEAPFVALKKVLSPEPCHHSEVLKAALHKLLLPDPTGAKKQQVIELLATTLGLV